MEAKATRRFFKLAKEPLLTSRLRGNPENRLWAKVLDFAIVEIGVFLATLLFVHAYWIVPWLLWAAMDRMGRGQSPGKWLLGLHTVEGTVGRKPNFFQCFARNIPCILLSMGLGCSGFLQWIFMGIGLAWCALETYFIFNLRSGVRVGDIFGNTRVFDYKDEHTQFIEQFLKESEST